MNAVLQHVVQQVSVDELDEVWNDVVPFISKAIPFSNGEISIENILTGIRNSRYQLWTVTLGYRVVFAFVTALMAHPSGKPVGKIFIGGGKGMKRWVSLLEMVEDWFREAGCVESVIEGRKGWERELAPMGYTHVKTTIGKPL